MPVVYNHMPIPPASSFDTTCRHAQMSKWRQKGFVQDSDEEEEESQLESQGSRLNGGLHGRVERVEDDINQTEQTEEARGHVNKVEVCLGGDGENAGNVKRPDPQERSIATLVKRSSPKRPSPSTPKSAHNPRPQPSESPDPLQGSQTPRSQRTFRPLSSQQRLESPNRPHSSTVSIPQLNEVGLPLQTVRSPHTTPRVTVAENTHEPTRASNILNEFGIVPLSDNSDDDDLSDPPTDLESPPPYFVQPHRKTAVQVVITSSKALQQQLVQDRVQERSGRDFRQRKPIQMHPYLLENEEYKRTVQSRGLQPVGRLRSRSPQGNSRQKDNETQEQEFNPDEEPTSSPPDAEIPVSSPVALHPGKDAHPADSTRRPTSKPMRRLPSTQLRHPHATKRRKLNVSSTQTTMPPAGPPKSIFDNPVMQHDIWSIPPNSPPYSSSPPLQGNASVRRPGILRRMTPAPNLPTPSTSSVMQDDRRLGSDSDSDTAPRSTQRPDSGLRRPKRVVLTDSSSSDDGSASLAEQSDNELRSVSRKMKGVLPASWIRYEQQIQKQREAQQRERERTRANTALSPGRVAPVRGVAQKITRPSGRPPLSSAFNIHTRDTVVISDDSEADQSVPASHTIQTIRDSVADASALAQRFDDRYVDDDNLSNMEHDRLPLPTLGGVGSKRKKQSKLPDVFGKVKKSKSSNGTRKHSAHKKRPSNSLTEKRKQSNLARSRRVSPPAMSVVDAVLSPSERTARVPQFLRVARRQALRRPDLARQSPRNKQIRLHTGEDTEDANNTLQQWRQGSLKPRLDGAVKERRPRLPMVDRTNNKHDAEQQPLTDAESVKDLDGQSEVATEVSRIRPRRNIPLGLQVFQRPSPRSTQQSKDPSQTRKPRKRPEYMGSLLFRTAQLEGDESAFGRDHRKIAFEKGLLHVDQQFGKQLSNEYHVANPQLARCLADGYVEPPPLPHSADHVGEHATEALSKIGPTTKRRLKRKAQARRVDVDAREFRQPSEPAVQQVLGTISSPQVQELAAEQSSPMLHGLGPYGTRYPITFDIYSVTSETYFHSSTFIGSDEFHRALSIGKPGGRDLDEAAGFSAITCGTTSVRCGPWNDETSSTLYEMVRNASAFTITETSAGPPTGQVHPAQLARSLVVYISDHLSFLDPIDRKDCVTKSIRLCQTLFDGAMAAFDSTCGHGVGHNWCAMRTMTYMLVISLQLYRIAQHPHVDEDCRAEALTLIRNAAKTVVTHLVRQAVPELGSFLELNKRHTVREKGVQDNEIAIESTVVCMHVLEDLHISGWGFWDLVSQELSPQVSNATHISIFETTWAKLFTFLPFGEIDVTGIPLRNRRETFQDDNWICIRDILRRIFELYTNTRGKNSASLNDYVRANLARCHRLMTHWHWRRPELMLNAVIDFFGKHGLKGLRHEASVGSIAFLDDLNADPSMAVEPNEYSFHTALKCLALGLRGMKDVYPEKKIRSFVFRSVPNHGRAYPKDQPLDEGNLAALRNHHDLLSTLYWNAPPGCRPKLEQIKGLVNHESSHREACRLSVRAWTNLTTFQLSTEEPYASTEPFALWHKDIMHQTLRQYKLAKVEAEDFLKSVAVDGATDISAVMVRQTMEKNQEQVIATLRDCIAGMSKAIRHARDQSSLKKFLIASDIMHLLELPHLEDRRLIGVIHDTLKVLQEYSKVQRTQSRKEASQETSEESQDYGDFPDMDDLDDLDNLDQAVPAKQPQQSGLDFIQTPLWHLLSNAFGAESAPDDILLKDCVDTWVCIAGGQVASGERSWSYYLDSFSHMSWKQLRQTEQTRKFGPYFLAALIDCDPAVYKEHRTEFLQALMVSLVERESMLRFQYQLLHAIMRTDGRHPLMQNLPFFRDLQTGAWDINPDSLRTRRLGLISSILSNMRDDFYAISRNEPARTAEAKRVYVCMLRDFMESMKHNYQKLSQGTTIIGAYVEFVQKIVRFLKQYTSDILPVLPFFTDSAAFPLPAEDPTYVVARLCGYAPKLLDSGTAKQLSVFIETVVQQAAADNQQVYLVHQLTSALCTDESPAADRVALRSALLQAIFPAYIEEAFSSSTAFTIGRPILLALPSILDTMIFDLRVTQPESVNSITSCIISVSHAFIRGTEQLKDNYLELFQRPYVFSALAHMLDAMISILALLKYMCSRTLPTADAPPLAAYIDQFITYIAALLHDTAPDTIPSYPADSHAPPLDTQHANLLAFCRRSLEETLSTNWSKSAGAIWFGVGNARREILLDIGTVEEESLRFDDGVRRFQSVFDDLYGFEQYHGGHQDDIEFDDVVV
ncbi:hypothetical protein yc1106_08433 [Curvularia clavata]|uniref:Mus7/MMS22 family-domain-containing protein n=1 Tax=Curvularia clavata TaxID=95742 RepID=A0A9Q9DWR1_CURCL|nr:hypothetical protein yc1106_08433 [Curvularia clavata]